MNSPNYTSRLSVPYASFHSLQTLDLHTRTSPPTSPAYNIVYIHGGAFRDPLKTSQSLLPSLPLLFKNPNIIKVASVNYGLSPYPTHPTHPSSPGDKSRNARWPDHINDVRSAIAWLFSDQGGGWKDGEEWLLVGHSVGGTMAMMLAMEPPEIDEPLDRPWGDENQKLPGLKGVVGLSGIYDFGALRDAHLAYRDIYDTFTTAAFGPEERGGWERGDLLRCRRETREGLEVVLVAGSRGDELVEWAQAESMFGMLKAWGRIGLEKELVEVEGKHDAIVNEGKAIGKLVERALLLIQKGEQDS